MRHAVFAALAVLAISTTAAAKDVFLSIGGSTGSFHTDMRIFNPSTTKDIQVQATLLAIGNQSNSAAQTTTFTVPKRKMLVYNDVLTALFSVGGLGGLRLKSDDDFIATQRIYSVAADGSTTGQYLPGLDTSLAKKRGVIIQLRNNGGPGQIGTFRTNIGALNPNDVAANVTWRLYDKNNALVGDAMTKVMPPLAVISPTSVGAFALNVPASVDLTDAWISFDSDQPLFAYASVVDNSIGADGTLITNFEDTGIPQTSTPQGKVVNVTLRVGHIDLSPGLDGLVLGDTVTFRIHSEDVEHGFQVNAPNSVVLTTGTYKASDGIVEKSISISKTGTYGYFCTVTTCSPLHGNMAGSFVVGDDGGYPGGPGYK